MLFISKKYLAVHCSDKELDAVRKDDLREILMEKPSNTIYFETIDDGLYGMVSYGDILKERDGWVPINKSFISLGRAAYMEARKRFRKADTICEIPVVEDGALIGEFHKFDDELMLDRVRDLEFNAYAPAYFETFENIALVNPPASRDYKLRYFEKLVQMLDRYGVDYTVIDFADIMGNLATFDKIIVVDEQERRGAQLVIDLFEYQPHYFYKITTFLDLFTKLESAEVMNYEEAFASLKSKGIDIILMTARHNDSDYVVRTEQAMKDRFPIVINNLNALMGPYEREFFDDLYENRAYVDNIETGYFVVEKDRGSFRLRDIQSDYINVVRGERVTAGQPEDYTRTIYFFGPCLVIGSYVGDDYTIESQLQAMINEAGYKVRVVNCGCWGGNVASVARMLTTPIREGDIVVMLLEDAEVGVDGIKEIDLWNILEENQTPSEWMLDLPQHANHHVCRQYAKGLYDVIFDDEYRDNAEFKSYIKQDLDIVDEFFIQKYFHGLDLGRFDKVTCSVFNGNPFTNGHRHLVEVASGVTDHVYLLTLKEDASVFSFNERYAMAVDAMSDLENVTVIPSGLFIGNINSFPAYYAKVYEGSVDEQARKHVETYASVATLLHATHRFVGEEPVDLVTDAVNKASQSILPGYGIETVVVERIGDANGDMITGSRVRELAANDDMEMVELVPASSLDIIRCETINAF